MARHVRAHADSVGDRRGVPPGWPLWPLLVLAVAAGPELRAARAADPDLRVFDLRIVGPDGKPIPEALVEIRGDAEPTAAQVRRGTFVRKARYGTELRTDDGGQIVVAIPEEPERFDVMIRIPGYGPYWAGWSSQPGDEPIPPRFTAKLDAAWSVGGAIVDAAGKPVSGATIQPSIEFKKRPGDFRQFGSGAYATSDAAGRWHFDSVPVSLAEVRVEISHPDFRPMDRRLPRSEFGIERGGEPASRIVLDRGLIVTGTVTGLDGKPIAGALVRTKFLNNIREARTGPDGSYHLSDCEPVQSRIVVSAKGRAMDMKVVRIDPEMEPVDFQLGPGGTVRIRVVDHQGRPVPKARILFQGWRGPVQYFEFRHVNEYADDQGVWVWNEAPLDEFTADICDPDGPDLSLEPLIARAEEYVFRLPGTVVISGKVVDAETKQPIKSFRVVPRHAGGSWSQDEAVRASEGRFQLRRTRGELAQQVRIEADGYQPEVSREIKSTEEKAALEFALTKVKDSGRDVAGESSPTRGKVIVGRVITPAIKPAAEAKVALGVAGSQITIHNGDLENGSLYTGATTDDTGRFQLPAQSTKFHLVITHPEGFAHIQSGPVWDTVKIIRLQPWARVEGTFRVGPEPTANVPLWINKGFLAIRPDGPTIHLEYEATTGPSGRFVFDRVTAGPGSIGRNILITVDDGAREVTSSGMFPVTFVGGETHRIELGGNGRPVIGRLQRPEGFRGNFLWSFGLLNVTVAGRMRANTPSFTASIDGKGRFRIDDVPAGDYVLNLWPDPRHGIGRLPELPFKVPPADGKRAAQPVDLGTLTLEK